VFSVKIPKVSEETLMGDGYDSVRSVAAISLLRAVDVVALQEPTGQELAGNYMYALSP